MVNDAGQLYTIEGIAAGLIMLLTAFIVVNSTSVYTPGDTHISDMQLEVLGSDALIMMNTAPNSTLKSPLQTIVETDDAECLRHQVPQPREQQDRKLTIIFISWQTLPTTIRTVPSDSTQFPSNSARLLAGGEHAVRVSEWVIVEKKFPECKPRTVQVNTPYSWRCSYGATE